MVKPGKIKYSVQKECLFCKNKFYAYKYNVARGWGLYCGFSCRQKHRGILGLCKHSESFKKVMSENRMGDKNPNWKGNNINPENGRQRARSLYGKKPCIICDKQNAEIHHKDGNPMNNDVSNILFLCHFHHNLIDGRLAMRVPKLMEGGKKSLEDYYETIPREEILSDYKNGMSFVQIAKKYKKERHTVSSWIKKWNSEDIGGNN